MLKRLWNDILENDITVIASRPLNGKVNLTLDVLYEFGIKQKKKIRMFHFDNPSSFYVEKLTSLISNIDEREIHEYFHPCRHQRNHLKIKAKPFIKALEKVINSNIEMVDLEFGIVLEDMLDYLLDYDEKYLTDLIIIDTFDSLVKKSKFPKDEVLRKLKEYAKKYHTKIVLLSNVDRKAEERKRQMLEDIYHYETLKKYADKILLTYRKKAENPNFIVIQTLKNKKIEKINNRKGSKNHE